MTTRSKNPRAMTNWSAKLMLSSDKAIRTRHENHLRKNPPVTEVTGLWRICSKFDKVKLLTSSTTPSLMGQKLQLIVFDRQSIFCPTAGYCNADMEDRINTVACRLLWEIHSSRESIFNRCNTQLMNSNTQHVCGRGVGNDIHVIER